MASAPIDRPAYGMDLVPASAPGFIGRHAEIAEVRRILSTAGHAGIFSVTHIGGVGKTALALKIAEELTPQFPDARVYLDLQGADGPLSAAAAMMQIILALRPWERVPASGPELGALYRSELERQRTLLVLDNAAGSEQIESLLPPAGCAVVLTSRSPVTLPALTPVEIGPLLPAESRALLLNHCPRIGDAASHLVHLCEGLPLAMVLVGRALAGHPELSPQAAADQLGAAREHLDPVQASLELAYGLLPVSQQRLWGLLAVFPSAFDTQAVTAVTGSDSAIGEALEDLRAKCLLEQLPGPLQRYRFHDLCRAFAARQLDEMQRTKAFRRHAAHYVGVLQQADQLYLEGGPALGRGLRLFDMEWANIEAGQRWAAAHVAHDTFSARICSAYPDAGAYCLAARLHSRTLIAWQEAALSAARLHNDRASESKHLGNMGTAYAQLADYRRAIELHEQSMAISRELGDRQGEGVSLGILAAAHAQLGDLQRALEMYERRLTMARELEDRRGEGVACGNLGVAFAALGEPRRALQCHGRELIIARELGDRHAECSALTSLGCVFRSVGDPHRAVEHHHQALALARELGTPKGEADALGNLAIALLDLDQTSQAIELLEQQLAITRRIGDRSGEAGAFGNLGNAYAALGELRQAIRSYEQHLAIAGELGDRHGEGVAVGNLGLAYATLGESTRAVEYYHRQLDITREIGDLAGQARASWNLGLIHEAQGDLARAADLMQILVDWERESGHESAEADAQRVAAIRAHIAPSGTPRPVQPSFLRRLLSRASKPT